MDIRTLSSTSDRAIVAHFFACASDYVLLETDHPPDSGTVDEFFDDRPPSVAPDDALHLGLFEEGNLLGILGMAIGYPVPTDAYIGLLLLTPAARGQGIGKRALDHATRHARVHGAERQLVAVLEANPKGRAFWEREGFVLEKTFAPTNDKHTRHRLTRAI